MGYVATRSRDNWENSETMQGLCLLFDLPGRATPLFPAFLADRAPLDALLIRSGGVSLLIRKAGKGWCCSRGCFVICLCFLSFSLHLVTTLTREGAVVSILLGMQDMSLLSRVTLASLPTSSHMS